MRRGGGGEGRGGEVGRKGEEEEEGVRKSYECEEGIKIEKERNGIREKGGK